MTINIETLRILNPYQGIYAYYDGRMQKRLYSEKRKSRKARLSIFIIPDLISD